MLKPIFISLAVVLIALAITKFTQQARQPPSPPLPQASSERAYGPRVPLHPRKNPEIPLKWTGYKHAVNPSDELRDRFCSELGISEIERATINGLLKTLRLRVEELMLDASKIEPSETGEVAVISDIQESIAKLESEFAEQLRKVLDEKKATIVAHQVKHSDLIPSGKPARIEWAIAPETHDFSVTTRGSRESRFLTSELASLTPQKQDEALDLFAIGLHRARYAVFFDVDDIVRRVTNAAMLHSGIQLQNGGAD